MEPEYWKPTLDEAKKFLTYGYVEEFTNEPIVIEFYKKQVPVDVLYPAKSREGEVEKSKEWFIKTNEEDLFVLEKEREAFELYYRSLKREIIKHIKYNEKI
jgi:hypothetical protein